MTPVAPASSCPLREQGRSDIDLLARMLLIRRFDERLIALHQQKLVPGHTSPYVGQEAIAIGVAAELCNGDVVASHHRPTGHALAAGLEPARLLAELMGREGGHCRGRAGKHQVSSLEHGFLGANGVVGGGIPIATGAALGLKMRGTDRIAISYFGDGATNTGAFHEALNLAAVWSLPVVFVCENNGYAFSTRQQDHQRIRDIAERADGYGMPGQIADGNDIDAVRDAVRPAIARARAGDGPTLLDLKTHRWYGQYDADDSLAYRTQAEIEFVQGALPDRDLARPSRRARRAQRGGFRLARARDRRDHCARGRMGTCLASFVRERRRCARLRSLGCAMSALTLQQALRAAHFDLMEQDSRVFVMGEDVGVLGGAFGITAGLLQRFGPERVRDAPISEAAIIGAAIGAALVGMRPICEMQFVDFLFVALDQLLHQAALAHYASGGANALPLVIRANYGVGPGSGPQDSGTLYGALLQFPGLTVVIPSSPSEAANLLAQAVRDPNPVLFLEPRELYPTTDLVPDLPALPMTRARVLRQGDHLTCVAAGGMVRKALAAAERVAAEKVSVEVIDLRCVMPLDESTIITSAARTGRVLVLDEAPRGGGLAAEVLALVAETATARAARVLLRRLTAAPTPIGYAPHLAAAAVPDARAIEAAMRELAHEPRA